MTPWTIARQVSLFMEFPRQEYWSELPFPPPGDLPDPWIESASLHLLPWQADCLPPGHLGSPTVLIERGIRRQIYISIELTFELHDEKLGLFG